MELGVGPSRSGEKVLFQWRSVLMSPYNTSREVVVTDSVYTDGNFALRDADSRGRRRQCLSGGLSQ